MAHYTSLKDVNLSQPSIVSVGVFDGVHRGHQMLIKHIVTQAKQRDCLSVVMTFFPHPDVVIHHIDDRYYLTTPEYRACILQNLGVDVVITYPFDDSVRHILARDFVQHLCDHLQMRQLWVGRDFVLGHHREGNIQHLTQLGNEMGYDVHALELITSHDTQPISSSQIRQCLADGNMAQVTRLLGRAYSVNGAVVHGFQRGRTIGFPTANIDIWDKQLIPVYGVYAGWICWNNQKYQAVTNIGIRPTFDGDSLTVEAHILDFDQDIYDQDVTLTLEHFIRTEQKFEGIDALKSQLAQDVITAREYLS